MKPHSRIGMGVLVLASLLAGCAQERRLSTSSPAAEQHYADGVKAWRLFYYREAQHAFEQAIEADSGFAAAWGRLAMLHANSLDQAGARRTMARALALSSSASPREQLLIRLWNARLEYQQAQAAAIADSLIQEYPDEAEVYVIRGQLFELQKNVEAAVEMYQRCLEADSGYSQAVMSLGYAYSTLGEQDKAVSFMQRYITMAPEAADPRASYADILVRAGRYDEALEQYHASLALKPDYWYAEGEIGGVYMTLGRLTAAGKQFERSLTLLPDNGKNEATSLRVRGYLALFRNDNAKAAGLFGESITQDSSSLNAGHGLCLALARLKRFEEAEKVLGQIREELKAKNLTNATLMQGYHVTRSRVLLEEGQLDSARKACRDAFGFSSPLSRGAVFVQLARVDLAAGNNEAALDDIDGALKVNRNYPDALLMLTRIYHAMGDKRMTAEISRRLLDLWKDADSDFYPLVELKRMHGPSYPT